MLADASASQRPKSVDCVRIAPGTPAGRYLRRFWQPVYHSADLAVGSPVPLCTMSEDCTLYRGESGQVHLVGPWCPHRGTQLSSGWVEGDGLRCFCHCRKFDGTGQCAIGAAADREGLANGKPDIIDIRPQIEIDIQLEALHTLGDRDAVTDPAPSR